MFKRIYNTLFKKNNKFEESSQEINEVLQQSDNKQKGDKYEKLFQEIMSIPLAKWKKDCLWHDQFNTHLHGYELCLCKVGILIVGENSKHIPFNRQQNRKLINRWNERMGGYVDKTKSMLDDLCAKCNKEE